jgi:hypothetical protein
MATETIDVKLDLDRSELDVVLADLERALAMKKELEADTRAELASVKSQLDSTEKAYDRSLQHNINLDDQLKRMTTSKAFGMGSKRSQEFLLEMKEFKTGVVATGQPPPPKVKVESIVSGSAVIQPGSIVNGSATILVKGDGGKKIEETLGPALDIGGDDSPIVTEGQNLWDASFTPEEVESLMNGAGANDPAPVDEGAVNETAIKRLREYLKNPTAPVYPERSEPVAVRLLQRSQRDLERRLSEAQGARAKMKDTLGRTQNACRRYKVQIARQRAQLEALQDVANAAFPLYAALAQALDRGSAFKDAEAPSGLALQMPYSAKLERQCIDFHNKFNIAAETLSHGA